MLLDQRFPLLDSVGRYDAIVLGMGSWAIGGQNPPDPKAPAPPEDYGRWPLKKYAAAICLVRRRILDVVGKQAEPRKLRRVVWTHMPAYPHNTRRYAKLKGEYRTNPRIQLWNTLAEELLLSGQSDVVNCSLGSAPAVDVRKLLRFVDAFAVTYPLMHLSVDHNHFTTYPQDAVLHMLLNSLLS